MLRPGMYATATIQTTPVKDALQVPREAVIDTGTRQIAFVVKSSGHFEPRDVHMGITGNDGRVQILDGLAAGESVVTSGQFLMDVESRTTEAVEKLRSAAMPVAMDMPPASQPARSQMAMDMPMPATSAAPAVVTAPTSKLTLAFCPMKKRRGYKRASNWRIPTTEPPCPTAVRSNRFLMFPASVLILQP